jgi:hypothetical protein
MCQHCDTEGTELASKLLGFKLMGQFFGYPECCIEAFLTRARKMITATDREAFEKAALVTSEQDKFTLGFVPCPECAKKYPPGQEFQLISNRVCSVPYPDGSTYGAFEEEFDNYIQSQFKTKEDVQNIN